MLALVNGVPKTLTLKQMLEEYINFQVEVITRRTQYDLKKAKEREHILKGLTIALDNIDEVIEIMKTSKNIPEGKQRLCDRFKLSEVQADHIANMTLGRLTGLERQKIIDELKEPGDKDSGLRGHTGEPLAHTEHHDRGSRSDTGQIRRRAPHED